jgi:hypothetical protein
VPPTSVLLDDRLLIEELLLGLPGRRPRGAVLTTSYWYYRACRASVAGGAGRLSGPFEAVPIDQRAAAIQRLLALPERIGLPDAREIVPAMATLARRHARLNLLNLEVVAAACWADATVWLSPESASGVLPDVLDAESVRWRVVDVRRPPR